MIQQMNELSFIYTHENQCFEDKPVWNLGMANTRLEWEKIKNDKSISIERDSLFIIKCPFRE